MAQKLFAHPHRLILWYNSTLFPAVVSVLLMMWPIRGIWEQRRVGEGV